jgi:hypothetical protein
MSFAFNARELRRRLDFARKSYRDEFIDFLPRSYSCVAPRSYSHASPRTSSRALPHFSHGPNHCIYGFGSWENNSVPRSFGYSPHLHRGDHMPRRHGFLAGESYTHLESRHLDGPQFPHRGSHPTGSKTEVQKTMKTSSGRMVKCWIPKIYLTNPGTEPSTSSHPM